MEEVTTELPMFALILTANFFADDHRFDFWVFVVGADHGAACGDFFADFFWCEAFACCAEGHFWCDDAGTCPG